MTNKEERIRELFRQNEQLEEELPDTYLDLCHRLGIIGGEGHLQAK